MNSPGQSRILRGVAELLDHACCCREAGSILEREAPRYGSAVRKQMEAAAVEHFEVANELTLRAWNEVTPARFEK